MGMSFANIHLYKHNNCNTQTLCDYLCNEMQKKQYIQTTDRDSADITAVIYETPHSKWLTLSIDTWQQSSMDWQHLATMYSDRFATDALVTACFDSDYLLMHIRNTANGMDGWANVGKPVHGKLSRRTSLTAFRDTVSDFDAFKSSVKKTYVCAEEALFSAANTLGLEDDQCTLDAQYIDALDHPAQTVLYFTAPPTEIKAPAFLKFSGSIPSLQSFGNEMKLAFYNMGGKSKGVSVMFDASKGEELTFTDVILAVQKKPFVWKGMQTFPITLEERTLVTGEKVYYGECADIIIPPYSNKVRWMSLQFIPQGNPRKVLDIKVTISPFETEQKVIKEQKVIWYFWKNANSKREYIERENSVPRINLNPDDYDLD